jgi:hypothetical protein
MFTIRTQLKIYNTMPNTHINTKLISPVQQTTAGVRRYKDPGAGSITQHYGIHSEAMDVIPAGMYSFLIPIYCCTVVSVASPVYTTVTPVISPPITNPYACGYCRRGIDD